MTDKEMIEEFIDTKRTEEEKMTIDFAKAILDYEIQKKLINNDIKDIKKEAKVNGIQVKSIMKVINDLKKAMKVSEMEQIENENIRALLIEDSDIKFKIETLIND